MELLTPLQMASADALTMASGTTGFALMKAAGQAVARAAATLVPIGPIVVVAGQGNNGGDGFIAAAELAAQGREVSLVLVCDPDTLKGDAALAAAEWGREVLVCAPQSLGQPALIIDALFGAGLDRPIKGNAGLIIEAMNASGAPILAIDLPSGINGETGAIMGVAVQASETITFFRRKPGHLLLPGRKHCGHVRLIDIGIAPQVLDHIRPMTFENSPDFWRSSFPVPKIDGHKYGRGHAVVLSGDIISTGAARLAARGALRGGAGLVTVLSPHHALMVNAVALTAIMLSEINTPAELTNLLKDRRFNACVIGPGIGVGVHTCEMALAALSKDTGLVLDADGLTSFAGNPDGLFAQIKQSKAKQIVLTPHGGEFAKLFKAIDGDADLPSKLDKARAAAQLSGAIVLFKGAATVIAEPNGRAVINVNAPPWLATAGAGDVLAGMIAAMLAQGVPAFEAACVAAWMHGEAAREVGPGLIAEDLPEALPTVFRKLFERYTIAEGL